MTAQSQTEKGKFLLSGGSNLSFYTYKNNWEGSDYSDKSSSISLTPQGGYFITDGLAIGAEIPFYHYWNSNYKSTSFSFGPFLKYYLGKSKFKPYLLGAVDYGKDRSKADYETSSYEYTSKIYLYKLEVGMGIFINKNLAIDFGFQYIYQDLKLKVNEQAAYNKGNSKDLDFTVGFTVIL
jgi:hypothetical protein